MIATERVTKPSRKNYRVLTIMLRILPDIFKVSPKLLSLYFILSIAHGISFGLIVMFQQHFFDNTGRLISKQVSLKAVLYSLLVMGVCYAANQLLSGAAGFVPKIIGKKAGGYLSSKIHLKISALPPIFFEDTEKLDTINKAEQGKNNAMNFTFTFIDIFLFYIPYFAFMSMYLYSLKPILLLSVLLVFLPVIITQLIRTRLFSTAEDSAAPVRRQYEYYEECLVSREYYKETRQLGGFNFFKNKYSNALSSLQKIQLKATIKTGYAELGIVFLCVLGYSSIIYLLFTALMEGSISVGSFAAVYASIGWMYDFMDEIINCRVSDMAKNIGTIRNYLDFLELDEKDHQPIKLASDCNSPEIQLQNVTFSYPGAGKAAVNNVTLTVKAGETIAIVGENGSGKSTLIKLISGFYSPEKGKVTYNGIDICKVDKPSLYKNISAVFQKYQKYQMTLRDNITISDYESVSEKNKLTAASKCAGVAYQNRDLFPQEYETMLSREFGGVDLSTGQWQRIAVARAFFREHGLILLDEPTSAVDPYEETRIYKQFSEISAQKTAILVTHRLGSIKLADRIFVMKEGEIVQSGSHEELISQDGEYFRLYQAQQQW